MPITLKVLLHSDRMILGSASLIDETGKILLADISCLGVADNAGAIAHGNPSKNPIRPYGNTPTGAYRLIRLAPKSDKDGYGPNHVYLMDPIGGQAVVAESEPNLRSGLLVHGGKKNSNYTRAPFDWKGLRPTYGCLRFADEDMVRIDTVYTQHPLAQWLCEVSEVPGGPVIHYT